MPLETATYLSDLVTSNPAHTDGLSQADSHLRLLKSTLKATFPNIDAPVTATPAILNALVANAQCPPGALMDFAMAAAPAGWLACDGQSVATATYPALFAAIGYTWGGSGANFTLPPLQKRFRRHRDSSTYSGAVGNLQAPANLAHTHGIPASTTDNENAVHSHALSGTFGGSGATLASTTGTGTTGTGSTGTGTTGAGSTSTGTTGTGTTGTGSTGTGSTGTGTSGAMSANADHSHTLGAPQNAFITSINNGSLTSQGNVVVTAGTTSAGWTTSSTNLAHTHSVPSLSVPSLSVPGLSVPGLSIPSLTVAGLSVPSLSVPGLSVPGLSIPALTVGVNTTLSGSTGLESASHAHGIPAQTSLGGSADNALEARPYSATVLTCIKF